MELLLISNSTNAGESYLEHAKAQIAQFLGEKSRKCLFIPYAAVSFSYDEYEKRVSDAFQEIGHQINSIHNHSYPAAALDNAEAIIVGGGNTFHLLRMLQENNLLASIARKVEEGIPFIGWSAGSNLTCPTIRTTNDMPIVEPVDFNALGLIPFQINPHYLDANPEGHAGETREMRIQEFIQVNEGIYVVGLREGTMLQVNEHSVTLLGPHKCRIFRKGMEPIELGPKDNLDFLLS
jgi:dipeptidase E